jgi:hypothetical protein
MKAWHALWPLLIGLIGTESLFEERHGSGNLREIQVKSASFEGTGAHSDHTDYQPSPRFEEVADELPPDIASNPAGPAAANSPTGPAPSTHDQDAGTILAQGGSRIAPPRSDLIEQTLLPGDILAD